MGLCIYLIWFAVISQQWKLQRMYFCEIATWRRIWAVRHLGVGSWDPLVRQKWRQIWKCCLLHNIYILLFNIYTRRLNICGVGFIQYLHMPPSVYLQSYVQRGGRRIWREETLELRRIWVGAPPLSFSSSSSSSVLRQDIGRHPAPGTHLLLPVAHIIVFENIARSREFYLQY